MRIPPAVGASVPPLSRGAGAPAGEKRRNLPPRKALRVRAKAPARQCRAPQGLPRTRGPPESAPPCAARISRREEAEEVVFSATLCKLVRGNFRVHSCSRNQQRLGREGIPSFSQLAKSPSPFHSVFSLMLTLQKKEVRPWQTFK